MGSPTVAKCLALAIPQRDGGSFKEGWDLVCPPPKHKAKLGMCWDKGRNVVVESGRKSKPSECQVKLSFFFSVTTRQRLVFGSEACG
jgi:hypothetical protein